MPELPPAAAAAFIISLLAVLAATLIVVRIRSRRRQTRLALMVRATAPIPRPTVSTIEPPPDSAPAPLRGQSYQSVEQRGHFAPFEERPGREPAAGRPARRPAAQVAHAAPVELPSAPAAALPVTPAPRPESLPQTATSPSHETPSFTGLSSEGFSAQPSVTEVDTFVPAPAVAPDLDAAPAPMAPPKAAGGLAAPVSGVTSPLIEEMPRIEESEPQFAAPAPASAPRRTPEITVLPPRPALPALMTREVTLGEAARILRGALPDGLTMTDGRQLRRAVAIGAATSVVAAAFAIRGRRR